jgi:Ribbon-helix-helix domain
MLELNREYHMAHLRGQAVKKSLVLKRVIAGHKTSVSLEGKFWDSLKEIAVERGITIKELVAAIDADREHGKSNAPATEYPRLGWRVCIPLSAAACVDEPETVA